MFDSRPTPFVCAHDAARSLHVLVILGRHWWVLFSCRRARGRARMFLLADRPSGAPTRTETSAGRQSRF